MLLSKLKTVWINRDIQAVGTLALTIERQSIRMSEINNGRVDPDGTEHLEM